MRKISGCPRPLRIGHHVRPQLQEGYLDLGTFPTPSTTQTRFQDGRPKRIYPLSWFPPPRMDSGKIGGSPIRRPGSSQASAPPGEGQPTLLRHPPPPSPWTVPCPRAGPCCWSGSSQGPVPVPTDDSCRSTTLNRHLRIFPGGVSDN